VISNLFVKICGITNLSDAQCAIEAGANALGFVFYPKSPRFLDLEKARDIFRSLPGEIKKVGVFVDEPDEILKQYLESLPLDYVQLHGNESPEYCSGIPVEVIKGLRIMDSDDIRNVPNYPVSFFLLDAFSEKEFGGTGKVFDWRIALEAKEVLGAPIILSGGLNPENAADAVGLVSPYGVDVSSGVEISPGIKDHAKIIEFIKNARNAGHKSDKGN